MAQKQTGPVEKTADSGAVYIELDHSARGPEAPRNTYATRPDTIRDIKDRCRRKRYLFEDRDFTANIESIYYTTHKQDNNIVWKRPHDIIRRGEPQLVVGTKSRLDLYQGSIGNCWYIAGVAAVATRPELFNRIVPTDQSFSTDYYGVFHFYFWRFGRWEEVIIDDRLPTMSGQLVFCRNRHEPNEFWPALIEKAYAKLHGSYEALDGGWTEDALVDFTGGVGKRVSLKNKRRNTSHVFRSLLRDFKHNTLLACCIYSSREAMESVLANGLVIGHAYSITMVTTIKDKRGNTVRLLRLRNPWGQGEWRGKWSDRSGSWNYVDESHRRELRARDEDGEFWMSFEDWAYNFEELQICHLPPDIRLKETRAWNEVSFHGYWEKGVNAGGSRRSWNKRSFWTNPRYAVTLKDPDETDGDNKCSIVISLMQKHSRAMRTDLEKEFANLSIAFNVFKVSSPVSGRLDATSYGTNALRLLRTGGHHKFNREVTCVARLEPGTYVIIPSTFKPNQSREFLLRCLTEHEVENSEVEVKPEGVTACCDLDMRVLVAIVLAGVLIFVLIALLIIFIV